MHKLIRRLALAAWILWPALGHAAGLLLDSAWLEDASGRMTLSQVRDGAQADAFQPHAGVLTRGYTASAHWLRLTIAPSDEKYLVLRVRPAYIDHVELFDPAVDGPQPLLSGDRHLRSPDGYQSLNHGFLIPGDASARQVYLRLRSTSTMLVHVDVLTPRQASLADQRQELLYSLYLGLLVAFLIWALLQWLTTREALIAAFLGKQAVVLAHAAAIQGYLPLLFGNWLSPRGMDLLTSVLVIAYVWAGVAFMFLLLREFKPVRWMWWTLGAMLAAYLPITALMVAGRVREALEWNMVMAALSAVCILLVALSTRAWQHAPADRPPPLPRWVLVSFGIALVAAAFSSALPSLAGIDGTEWTLSSPLFGGFLTSFLMTILLSLRGRNLEKQSQAALLELGLAEQAARSERARREEQERFVAMLTHELKTPLGVARISLGASRLAGPPRERIERALGNINAIVDRCGMTDLLEHRQLVAQPGPCSLPAVVDECIAGCSDPGRVKVLESNSPPVLSDSQLLSVCLANLIDNALKYAPADAAVTVRIRPQPCAGVSAAAGVAVTVANPVGPAGIPDAGQLFSKYYRGPGARSKSGSGLGLYLSRHIALLLGGGLSHRVEQDQVEFSLWVPA
jgi:two-component system, sensor histidine kinase LadS